MATVIRLNPGGGAVVEQGWLTIDQAKSLAERLAAEGEPAGCCWCVGLWDTEDEEVAILSPGLEESPSLRARDTKVPF